MLAEENNNIDTKLDINPQEKNDVEFQKYITSNDAMQRELIKSDVPKESPTEESV